MAEDVETNGDDAATNGDGTSDVEMNDAAAGATDDFPAVGTNAGPQIDESSFPDLNDAVGADAAAGGDDFPDFSKLAAASAAVAGESAAEGLSVPDVPIDVGAAATASSVRRKTGSSKRSRRSGKGGSGKGSSGKADEKPSSKLPLIAGGLSALVLGGVMMMMSPEDAPQQEEEVVDQGIPFEEPTFEEPTFKDPPSSSASGSGNGAAGSILNAAAGGGVSLKPGDFEGMIVDDMAALKEGDWSTAADKTYVSEGYAVSSEDGATISFPFTPKASGPHEVSLRFIPGSKLGKAIKVSIQAGDVQETATVNMASRPGSPRFQSLGVVELTADQEANVVLTVSGSGATADAVQIVPQ